MPSSSSKSPLEVDSQPGKVPRLQVDADGDAPGWMAENRSALRAVVTEHGAIQVRGLDLSGPAEVAGVIVSLTDSVLTEKEAFASRQAYAGGVYSSSAWPANQQMCMHHELSYRLEVPALMVFACLVSPARGGAISVADSASVAETLPADLVGRFEQEGWMLTRNYTEEIGLSLAEAFGSDNRGAIEKYCRSNDIDFDWRPDGGLRTRQRRNAVVHHPITGQRCWFNQIAFLNEWTMSPEVRGFLVKIYGPDGLPFNTSFGGGDAIGSDVVELINDVYDAHTTQAELRAGDLLLVDNIRTAHSREPFEGEREVVVALTEAVRVADLLGPVKSDAVEE